ncbi:nitroreductase family protein [Paenibacillus sp. 1P07SE]|uniref:nitroreductase family protein n=1 Tax=Paenibacillus sp. 1P07SE TaxID=3132209 RepID=UPI0039A60BE8
MSNKTDAVSLDIHTVIRNRHSVKHYDPTHHLSQQEILSLLEMASLAPSAWNLQHWKFLAITELEAKEKLLPIAYGQRQVVEASAVIAILGDLQANLNAETVYGPLVQAGMMAEDIKSSLVGQIEFAYANEPSVPRDEAIRNASLAAMQLMLAAKATGLDSCPMGGFDAAQFVEAFGVPPRYIPVMLVAIGKAALPARPSARYPVHETVIWNTF